MQWRTWQDGWVGHRTSKKQVGERMPTARISMSQPSTLEIGCQENTSKKGKKRSDSLPHNGTI